MADDAHEPSISIVVTMKAATIDLDVTNPVAVADLQASLVRAGVTHLVCKRSSGNRTSQGFDEVLEFEAILPQQ